MIPGLTAIQSSNQLCDNDLHAVTVGNQRKRGVNTVDADVVLYVRQLEAILTSEQSDGYLKEWARKKLEEIHYPVECSSCPNKTLVPV